MIDLDDVKSGNNSDRLPQMKDVASVYKFPEKKWATIRLFGSVIVQAGYWVRTKKKDGTPSKFWVPCISFDPATQTRDSTIPDPWAAAEAIESAKAQAKEIERDDMLIQYSVSYWMQGIVRSKQRAAPRKNPISASEKKSGFKDKDSESWTPVELIPLGTSLIGKIKNLKGLNTYTSKQTGAVKAYAVTDVKFGRDIRVLFDSSKAPADRYQVVPGDARTPLTEEEQEYLIWDTSTVVEAKADLNELQSNFDRWATTNGIKKPKKPKVEEDDFDDDEEDEDEAPKLPAKKSAKKTKPVEEDEDEDDFDDEEDEPVKPAKKSAKKTKPVEEDEDDFDDFDDEDEAPKRSAKRPAKKTKPVEDEDDFGDDEEDEPVKPTKRPAKKSAKKTKPVKEDEDEDDFGDDEEDEPVKPTKRPAKKTKPVEEDDFDDFDDE